MNTQIIPAKKSNVEVKVLSMNTLYKYAKMIIDYERKHFSQFAGINIFKVDGSIKQKYDHDKLTFDGSLEDGTHFNISYHFSTKYSFDANIRVCINGGKYEPKPSTYFCQYDSLITTLFQLEDNIILPTERDYSYLDTVFSVESLTNIAKEIEQAAKLYEIAANKMPHQFNEVFYIKRLTRN